MEREYCKKCSKCRERTVVIATVPYEVQFDYDGRKHNVLIPHLSVPQCAKCGNFSIDHEASEQISRAFLQQAGLLHPEEIRQQREKLGLSQMQLAGMLGVETTELAWWENGERYQTRTADQFLRAIFTVPELPKTLANQQALEMASVES